MVQMGAYEELLISSPAFNRLLDNINQQKQQDDSSNMKQEHAPTEVVSLEVENEKEPFLVREDEETKEKGAVKWHVYIEYIRAGVGLTIGLIWLIAVFIIRELISVFAGRWLAEWSEDEDYRHSQLKNCTGTADKKTTRIQSMTDAQWNKHRDSRFYLYCGVSFVSEAMCYFLNLFFLLGIALLLVIFTLLRTITMRFMCLNASRVLHNQ